MPRTVVTAEEASRAVPVEAVGGTLPRADEYQDRLIKYLPAEVLTLFVVADAAIGAAPQGFPKHASLWIAFLVCLAATPVYLHAVSGVDKRQQLAISTIGFAVWVFALGGPFEGMVPFRSVYAALLLPFYTFAIPILEARR